MKAPISPLLRTRKLIPMMIRVESQVKETELWKSATDVPDEVLDAAHRIEFTSMPSEKAA